MGTAIAIAFNKRGSGLADPSSAAGMQDSYR